MRCPRWLLADIVLELDHILRTCLYSTKLNPFLEWMLQGSRFALVAAAAGTSIALCHQGVPMSGLWWHKSQLISIMFPIEWQRVVVRLDGGGGCGGPIFLVGRVHDVAKAKVIMAMPYKVSGKPLKGDCHHTTIISITSVWLLTAVSSRHVIWIR